MTALSSYFYLMATASGTTLGLALCALIMGMILAMCFAALELVRWRWLALTGTALVTLLRGLPEIFVVLFIYFGVSQILVKLSDGVILHIGWLSIPLSLSIDHGDVSPFLCSVIALALLYAAYASQILRGAFQAISPGQWEAGLVLGMSNRSILFRLTLPQMWCHALPGLGNQWLVLLKDTALVSMISVNDLMLQTQRIVSFTKQPFTWYLLAAGMYLMITLFSQAVLRACERHATRFNKEAP